MMSGQSGGCSDTDSDSCRVEEFSVQGQVESKALGSCVLEGMQRGRLPAQSFGRCLGLRLSDFQCMKLWRGVLREFETHAFLSEDLWL